jgi:hypothetical protein
MTRVIALADASDGVILNLVFAETADELAAVDGALDPSRRRGVPGSASEWRANQVIADEQVR